MTDCRRSLPSASMMAGLAACPGRLSMTNALRESGLYRELPNKDAASGNRIHWWLATTPFHLRENLTSGQQLNGWEMSTARRAREMQLELINAWYGQGEQELDSLVECRLFYRTGLRPRFSGQPDFILLNDSRALLLDFKTGRIESDPSSDNLQLRTYAVLLKHNYPELVDIEAAIIEPNVSWESERVRYMEADLLQAENQILAIVDEAAWNQERRAGTWCKHCPARIHCPEAQNWIQTALDYSQAKSLIRDLPRGEAGSNLYAKIGLAEKLLKEMKDCYKQILLADPGALPGYILPEEGHRRRTVTDPAAFKKALEVEIKPEDIDLLADYPISKIEALFGETTGFNGKKLRAEFERLTAGSVTVTNDEPFIRALTKRERELPAKG